MTRPNILLIVMDTARVPNALPSKRQDIVPNLSKIADEGVVFENAVTTGPWTLPSHASMFTGQYTSDHDAHAGTKTYDPEVSPLPELLKENGYQTVAISNNNWISPEFGFGEGFEDFYTGWNPVQGGGDLTEVGSEPGFLKNLYSLFRVASESSIVPTLVNAFYARYLFSLYDQGARTTNWRVKRWMKHKRGDYPFFMFINYLEPHLEYDPPRKFRYEFLPDHISRSRADDVPQDPWQYISGSLDLGNDDFLALEALYNAEIHYLDYRIGKLMDLFQSEGILDDTFVIICSDHGENIGDHGLMDHQYCLYDTLLRVPLIARFPERIEPGRIDQSLVELRDIYPTLCRIAGTENDANDSISSEVLPLCPDDSTGRDVVFSEYLHPQPTIDTLRNEVGDAEDISQFDRALRSVRSKRWKFIEYSDGAVELFDLDLDPKESTDVSDEYPGEVDRFEGMLSIRFGPLEIAESRTVPMAGNIRRRLKDLGYL